MIYPISALAGILKTMQTPLNTETLIQNIQVLSDWEDRYKYIIQLGKQIPPLDPSYQINENIVTGCMSKVWLICEAPDKIDAPFVFHAMSNAAIVNGLIAILKILFRDKSAVDILKTDIEAIFIQLGLDQHLSPGRSNGFFSMVAKIKTLATQDLQRLIKLA